MTFTKLLFLSAVSGIAFFAAGVVAAANGVFSPDATGNIRDAFDAFAECDRGGFPWKLAIGVGLPSVVGALWSAPARVFAEVFAVHIERKLSTPKPRRRQPPSPGTRGARGGATGGENA